MKKQGLLWLMIGLLVACGGPSVDNGEDSGVDAGSSQHGEIAWFEGEVEEAFALAKEEGKPLFLYWGAVWCPPCHYLKDNIFKQPEFVAKSREFICLYMDGDTERAQVWGEKFGTVGYPTVVIFDPEGAEILRMTSGIPVEEYTGVLDAAIERMRPVTELLEAAREGRAEPQDLNLLAFHSWAQDSSIEMTAEEKFETFRELHGLTPKSQPVVRSRFLGLLLQAAAQMEADEEVFSEEDRGLYRLELEELLADRNLRQANLFFVPYSSGSTISLLEPEPGEARNVLVAKWIAAVEATEADEELSVSDRLGVAYARIAIARLELDEDAPLPDEVVQVVRDRVTWASGAVSEEGELQTVLNTMAGLLSRADLISEAEDLVTARIDETKAPYYYMSWLGELQAEAGNPEAAVAWHRKAWEAAEGANTRFQWGSGYLREAIDLVPAGTAAIERDAMAILGELLDDEGAFSNRNYSRFERLDKSLMEWAEGGEVVDRIREFVHATCDRFPDEGDDSSRARCEGFLNPEEEVE